VSETDDVTRRELDARFAGSDAIRDERIRALDLLTSQRFKERDQALALQAAELARRLDVLNHAHRDAMLRDSSFVGREVYDQRHSELERRVVALERWQSQIVGALALLASIGIVNVIAGTIVLWRIMAHVTP